MAASLAAIWRLWWKALLLGLLLALWRVGTAYADDCSGPSDCASSPWYTNALESGLVGTVLAGLGLAPIINLLFPGVKIPGMPGQPVAPRPVRPFVPTTGKDVRDKLDYLSQVAQHHKNPELASIVDKYRNSLVGPDGKVRPEEWSKFKQEAATAINKWAQSGEKPNSWIWDAGASALNAGGTFIYEAGSKVVEGVVFVGKGYVELGDALLHPLDTLEGMQETGKNIVTGTMNWMDKHVGRELAKECRDAFNEGRYVDALSSFAKIEGTMIWEAGKGIGQELLPVEEMQSLFDPNASLEEKLWAFPAAVAKLANLLTMSEAAMTMPVPGIDKATTLIPSVERAAAQLAQAEKLAALAQTEGAFGQAARATQKVEGAMGEALSGSGPITNYKQLQSAIARNPELQQAIDDAIRAGGDGSSLYQMAASGTMSKEASMLITARKLELQEQAMANATRRIIQEEVSAIRGAGGEVPNSFQTFNASQGSRTQLWGANAKTDLDQTILGIENVGKDRARQIVEEEIRRVGMNPNNLDMNTYLPGKGRLADAQGASAFSDDAVKRILNQGTSESGRYHVYVDRAGEVHVTGPFKGQGAEVLGPEAVYHTPGGRVPPGTPPELLTPQQQADLAQQMHKIDSYAQTGEWDRVVKSANRASDLGAFDPQTRDLLRRLAHEKRPAELTEMLHGAGYDSWNDFMSHLNGFGR